MNWKNDMAENETHDSLLNALALALVDHPRASLQELACAVGVSKATLYRFSRTRESLISTLRLHSIKAYKRAVQNANLDTAAPVDGIRALLENYYSNKELTVFLIHYWHPEIDGNDDCLASQEILDAFFLRGQQEGFFRIDISAVTMSECCHGLFFSLVDAERRGRVPRTKIISIIETMLLQGCTAAKK